MIHGQPVNISRHTAAACHAACHGQVWRLACEAICHSRFWRHQSQQAWRHVHMALLLKVVLLLSALTFGPPNSQVCPRAHLYTNSAAASPDSRTDPAARMLARNREITVQGLAPTSDWCQWCCAPAAVFGEHGWL